MRAAPGIELVRTTRLVCERLRVEHSAELLPLLQDPRVSRTLWPGSEPPTERQVLESTAEKARHWERYGYGMWLLRDRATGEMIGRGGLQWSYIPALDEVEVGWAIVPEWWGQGLATEMARAAIAVAFGPLALPEIIAFALPDNLASRRVMEKTGFRYQRDIVHAGLAHVLYRRTAETPEANADPAVTLSDQSPFL